MPIQALVRSIPRVALFGREIFHLYEKHPLLCNSIAGGTVFFASELVVQIQTQHQANPSIPRLNWSDPFHSFRKVDWIRVLKIAALGTVENGLFMLQWYKALTRFVGNGSGTGIVLAKCALDQAFFATQQVMIPLLPYIAPYVRPLYCTTLYYTTVHTDLYMTLHSQSSLSVVF